VVGGFVVDCFSCGCCFDYWVWEGEEVIFDWAGVLLWVVMLLVGDDFRKVYKGCGCGLFLMGLEDFSMSRRGFVKLLGAGGLGVLAGCELEEDARGSSDVEKICYNEVIVLDAGHGGKDPGAIYPFNSKNPSYREKDVTLVQAAKAKLILNERGYKNVYLTRKKDVFVSLNKRRKITKELDADVFVSFHTDSNEDESIFGQTTYFGIGMGSKDFARIMQKKLVEKIGIKFPVKNKGVKFSNYEVLKNDITSVLIESGFSSNIKDRMALKKNAYFVAKAVYGGIDCYLRKRR
jgi:N-acetylmuramoyl-L-alanine amidase